jgi:hypothetical protein
MNKLFKIGGASGISIAHEISISHRLVFFDLVFSSLLIIIFMALVPIVEWPDAMDHIERRLANETIYPFDFFSLLSQIDYPTLNRHHNFFSDQHIYQLSPDNLFINLERLPIILFFCFTIYGFAKRFGSGLILFCPPLIFSLAAPSQEVVAILMLLIAVVVQRKLAIGTVLFSLLAMVFDRSMVPNATFLILYSVSAAFRALVLNRRSVLVLGLFLLIFSKLFSPLVLIDLLNETKITFYGFAVSDLDGLSQFGQSNLLALIVSTMGLYGWLSIRPFPFFIYYLGLAYLFLVGFLSSQPKTQSLFIALFLVSYCVLWLLPPLAQARYYPLLSMMFWGIIMEGVIFVKMDLRYFYIFVIAMTGLGCLIPFLNII